MSESPAPRGALPEAAVCRGCGYVLAGVATHVCPECGRAFDPADARTFAASDRVLRARRRRKRLAIAAAAVAALYALAPRGYVVVNFVLTDAASGVDATVRHVRVVGPPWMPLAYPRWTQVDDRGSTPLAQAPAPGAASLTFRLSVEKWMIDHFWFRSVGSIGASGSTPPGLVSVVNQRSVTATGAGRAARELARDMAAGNGYGVRVSSGPSPPGDGEADLAPVEGAE